MKTQHLLYIITIGLGIVIGLLINRQQPQEIMDAQSSQQSTGVTISSSQTTSSGQLQSLQEDVTNLKLALAEEKKARQLLNTQIVLLGAIDTDDAKNRSNKSETTKKSPSSKANPGTDGWINADLLATAGVNELDVKRITDTFERSEMEKLYLRDTAVREGWTGTKRFREEMAKLNKQTDNFRSELSEHDYDAYLYATGSPNRIIVRSALTNSPASLAGIEAGDTIYKYDNVRVYTWADLRKETAKGNAEEMVPVQIIRDNKKMDIFVKRGPLGIRLAHLSLSPAG